jgi:hypothetical protein
VIVGPGPLARYVLDEGATITMTYNEEDLCVTEGEVCGISGAKALGAADQPLEA